MKILLNACYKVLPLAEVEYYEQVLLPQGTVLIVPSNPPHRAPIPPQGIDVYVNAEIVYATRISDADLDEFARHEVRNYLIRARFMPEEAEQLSKQAHALRFERSDRMEKQWVVESEYGTLTCFQNELIETLREMVGLIEGALEAGDELMDTITITAKPE